MSGLLNVVGPIDASKRCNKVEEKEEWSCVTKTRF